MLYLFIAYAIYVIPSNMSEAAGPSNEPSTRSVYLMTYSKADIVKVPDKTKLLIKKPCPYTPLKQICFCGPQHPYINLTMYVYGIHMYTVNGIHLFYRENIGSVTVDTYKFKKGYILYILIIWVYTVTLLYISV